MPWESDEIQDEHGRDWVKYLWYGIALLVAVGVVAMFMPKTREGQAGVTRARVSHILVKFETQDQQGKQAAIEKIKGLRQRIVDGENFAKIAGEFSDDRGSAGKGGDLGWVQKGELSDLIDRYVWSAPVNQVSEPYITENGLHIVVVREREIAAADLYENELKERVLKGQGATGSTAP